MSKKANHKKKKQPSHPFEIGMVHIHVISINEPDMVIRYQDGCTVESSIVLQACIWENIQEDSGSGFEFEP